MTDIVERLQAKKRNATDEEDDALDEIKSLRQQLAECVVTNVQLIEDNCRLVQQLELKDELIEAKEMVNEDLREQVAEVQNQAIADVNHFRTALAECQAREKAVRNVLRRYVERDDITHEAGVVDALALPYNSTALDEAIKQAKREALLEAKNVAVNLISLGYSAESIVSDISNMAKGLK
jgi:hypothetical protein